jgi:hypothetical protein
MRIIDNGIKIKTSSSYITLWGCLSPSKLGSENGGSIPISQSIIKSHFFIYQTTVSFANLQVRTQPIFALFEGFTSSKVQCTGHVGEPAPTL